jgi:hypothetical protein
MRWHRVRFHANYDDSRPVKVEPPGPWWETGLAGDGSYSVVVAYFPDGAQDRIFEFWPEASQVDWHRVEDAPTFTDRFPQPDDWDAAACQWTGGKTVAA